MAEGLLYVGLPRSSDVPARDMHRSPQYHIKCMTLQGAELYEVRTVQLQARGSRASPKLALSLRCRCRR